MQLQIGLDALHITYVTYQKTSLEKICMCGRCLYSLGSSNSLQNYKGINKNAEIQNVYWKQNNPK